MLGDMNQEQPWSVRQTVREDADGVFVPAEELPDAEVGDVVTFIADDAAPRHGRISALVDDDARGRFFTVDLDPPQT